VAAAESGENAEVVLRIFAAINRGDVTAVISEGTDDIVVDWSASVSPYRGVYRGKREVEKLYSDFLETWTQLSWEAEDLRELSGDRVIVTNHVRGIGRGSGARVDARGHHLWHFRDGRAASVRLFQLREEAEAAAAEESSDDRSLGA
jgi:ketosteroid isomerase-like protein